MTTSPLRLEREDSGLAVLTIDHPPLNFWGAELWGALPPAMDALAADPPRALLIRAEGKVFSGGVHVENFRGLGVEKGTIVWEEQMAMLHTLESLPCPTIFAAHALTLTASFELALGCDSILAAKSARFGLVERRVGLSPASGGVQRLTALAGANRAKDLVFSGDLYDADTMKEWGVVSRVFADDEFAEKSRAFALDLASGPTLGYAAAKELVRATIRDGVPAADAITAKLCGDLFGTDDLQRAVVGFLEHGPMHETDFNGR